ncbi:hypothetical protein V5O48_005311 [Marasmius crinis-equi]|uniref:Uncharacterized protein n=1 Tax=Marasmius crinis-equi TaxID=585013 RepID=A0ABR3FN25_9AGAR
MPVVTVKSSHLANPESVSKVAQVPYSVNVPAAAKLKKLSRVSKNSTNAPPLTNIERLKKREKKKGKAAEIKSEVAALRRMVRARCTELADLYDKKPRYLMDMFYQRSDLAAKDQYEVNPFNAYKSVVAHERREAPLHLLDLQSAITEDYKELDDDALEKVVEKYKELRDEDKREKIKRPSMREKMADVARTVNRVMTMMQGLKTQNGIEFIGLLVKNRPEAFMNPKWLATDGRIHDYLSLILRGWDPAYIGKKVEAFAVAGCDAAKIFKSQKDQAEALKRHVTRLIQDGLDTTCGTENQAMQYERFDTTITLRYRVIVEGWPQGIPFQKPSAFGGALDPLFRLRNAWQAGEAHFRKMGEEEFQKWQAERAEKIRTGDIVPKTRKKRSDAGVKRSKKGAGEAREPTSGGEDGDGSNNENESGGDGDAESDDPRPVKKAKTACTSKTTTTTKPTTKKPAKPKAPRKPRKPRRSSKPASSNLEAQGLGIDASDANTGPSDVSTPAMTIPTESHPRPRPRPVVPRKTVERVEEQEGEHVEGEGICSAPVAAKNSVDDGIPRGDREDAPDAPRVPDAPDDHQVPSTKPRAPFDDALIDPSLRPKETNVHVPLPIPETELTPTFESPPHPVRPLSPALSGSGSNQGKRKRRSEEERLREDAREHGMNDEKRTRVVTRKRHLGAGSFNPKARGQGVNSDDEGILDYELC